MEQSHRDKLISEPQHYKEVFEEHRIKKVRGLLFFNTYIYMYIYTYIYLKLFDKKSFFFSLGQLNVKKLKWFRRKRTKVQTKLR